MKRRFPSAPSAPAALAAGLVGALVFVSSADAKLARSGEPSVSFTAVGPAGMHIVGTTRELTVDDDGAHVTVVVPLANLQTGIGLRDRHMREKYLQVAQFPTAELQVDRAALKLPAAGADATGDGHGTMKLHGKTKDLGFHFAARRDGATYRVTGTMHVNMNDFGIETPSYLGVTVKPDVDVEVKFDAAE